MNLGKLWRGIFKKRRPRAIWVWNFAAGFNLRNGQFELALCGDGKPIHVEMDAEIALALRNIISSSFAVRDLADRQKAEKFAGALNWTAEFGAEVAAKMEAIRAQNGQQYLGELGREENPYLLQGEELERAEAFRKAGRAA